MTPEHLSEIRRAIEDARYSTVGGTTIVDVEDLKACLAEAERAVAMERWIRHARSLQFTRESNAFAVRHSAITVSWADLDESRKRHDAETESHESSLGWHMRPACDRERSGNVQGH